MKFLRSRILAAMTASALVLAPVSASAETITGALAKAYQNNSSLNYDRAGVRVTDENVGIAKSGMRPRVSATGSLQYQDRRQAGVSTQIRTGQFGISLEQPIFDGFQTRNNVRASEAQVQAAIESLRNTEMNTLFDAASAYMDVIRDRQIVALTRENLQFLEEQVRSARSRLEVGEGTRTDVAQAEANRQAAIAQLAAAQAQAEASEAQYRLVVGDDPDSLKTAEPVASLLPSSLNEAMAIAQAEHPVIIATQYQADAAAFSVKAAEGTLLPQVSASAGLQSTDTEYSGGVPLGSEGTVNSATVGLNLTVPIYQGGEASARVRQSKEQLGQARIDVDVRRDNVRQAITAAWTQYQAAQQLVVANRQTVEAARLALTGVIEERNVGQRTTLDVLDAQADLITAQINLVQSQRDVVVGSYAILSATGRLTTNRLNLQVARHDPREHFNAVKDKWYGLRTPDGR